MIFISFKKVIASFSVLILAILVSMLGFNENNLIETSGEIKTYKIIVDAGHGLPDGGAVAANGIEEASLNLQIATKLQEELESSGYDVIMTRETENNIADSDKQDSIKQMKSSDLTNRVKIANECKADFMISIHMNKYSESKYWGWQTFYSKNSESREKACNINSKWGFK